MRYDRRERQDDQEMREWKQNELMEVGQQDQGKVLSSP